jgi:hypothetical protein
MHAYLKAVRSKDTPPEEVQRLLDEATQYKKRWADEAGTVREASFVRLSHGGSVLAREYLSAGMSVILNGLTGTTGIVEAYGSLGGMPAIAKVGDAPGP